ncbi:hypothetical protein LIN78_06080 [Leeia sp. TBRC 13508]|uniref:Tetratricopeptide repeat protein n=1 Tax=Leeia speluncae TaxID=2884804 RepID=A0ABS8D4L5_9NEIS|nr:hypothetical protein [Leeia speluncae]MCB6183111.1 hypothetical protein [Leeia speluncae]
MFLSKKWFSITILVSAITVWACGPDFRSLLANRQGTLTAPIGNSFNDEVNLMVKDVEKQRLPIAKSFEYVYIKEKIVGDSETIQAEQQDLAARDKKIIIQMRMAANAKEAERIGQSLPLAIRLYTAGAVAYARPAATDPHHDEAKHYFESILALPAKEAISRAVWATYMLGKIALLNGDEKGASAHFSKTRQLAEANGHDPLGLAISSVGEDAKLFLNVGKYTEAIRLYALQAAYGDASGLSSLKQIASDILSNEQLLSEQIKTPAVQRLLSIYVLNLSADRLREEQLFNAEKFDFSDLKAKGSPLLNLISAAEKAGVQHFAYADKLAAVAYNAGRFDTAVKLAQKSDTATAAWVKAKLAQRNGDTRSAAAWYAKAIPAFPSETSGNRFGSAMQAKSEEGLLNLTRGEYTNALAQLYRVGKVYWLDLAYVAERVVTVDELKSFVDQHVSVPALPKTSKASDGSIYAEPDAETEWPATNTNAQLRDLLARRLVREERYEESLPYFHQKGDYRFADQEITEHVKAYADALSEANSAWTRVGRSEALFKAAVLARQHGMEMMGYELFPDQFSSGGNFFWMHNNDPKQDKPSTATEVARYIQTAPKQSNAYHYRYLAVDLAKQAANELPQRSQAYAAVLCRAASWMGKDEVMAAALYRTYLTNGAYVSWGAQFGSNCPEPEFERANKMIQTQYWISTKHWIRHYAWLIALAVVGVTLCAIWLVKRRKVKTTNSRNSVKDNA